MLTSEQVQHVLAEIIAGIPKEQRDEVEDLVWELFHFAEDAARGRDEAIAAQRALEELMAQRQQQLSAYKRKIERLEASLEKAKRDTQTMRDKLDEWCQALNREEERAEEVPLEQSGQPRNQNIPRRCSFCQRRHRLEDWCEAKLKVWRETLEWLRRTAKRGAQACSEP